MDGPIYMPNGRPVPAVMANIEGRKQGHRNRVIKATMDFLGSPRSRAKQQSKERRLF